MLQAYANPMHLRCAVDDRSLLSERGGARLKGHFVHVLTRDLLITSPAQTQTHGPHSHRKLPPPHTKDPKP